MVPNALYGNNFPMDENGNFRPLKALKRWIEMVLGTVLYIFLRKILSIDDSLNWKLWYDIVCFGTLVYALYYIYARPKK